MQFAALIRGILASGLSRTGRQPLRIDPRLLKDDPTTRRLEADALAPSDSVAVRERRALLRRFDIPEANAISDLECAFSQGLHVTGERPAFPARCEAMGDFVTVIFGVPRPGGPYFPPDVDEREESGQGSYTVRAIEVTSYSYYVFDVVLRPLQGSGWEVVEKKVLYGASS